MAFLEVRGLTAGYGRATVLHGVDLDVDEGAVLGVLGRNGAGKSTFLATVMGLTDVTGGSVRLRGRELAGRRPHAVAGAGVALVPQGRRVFGSLTVDEHLELAARGAPGRRTARPVAADAFTLLPGLSGRRRHRGRELSGGEQQALAIACALLIGPDLLLLDEPSEGLAPDLVDRLGHLVLRLAADGVTVVLVEQDLALAVGVADDVAVMSRGRFVHRAGTAALRPDPATAARRLGSWIAATAAAGDR